MGWICFQQYRREDPASRAGVPTRSRGTKPANSLGRNEGVADLPRRVQQEFQRRTHSVQVGSESL